MEMEMDSPKSVTNMDDDRDSREEDTAEDTLSVSDKNSPGSTAELPREASREASDYDPQAPVNHHPLPKFKMVVAFLESMSKISGDGAINARKRLVGDFCEEWRRKVGDDFYPAFRLIMPHLDTELRQNVREALLGKILAGALNLPSQSRDAKQLVSFKGSGKWNRGGRDTRSEFSDLACHVVTERTSNEQYSEWTVGDVIEKLSQLADANKIVDQVSVFKQFLEDMNPVELKWIVRIILRNMGLHYGENRILEQWHRDSIKLLNVSSSLKIVCDKLWDRSVSLQARDQIVQPLARFRPMRAKFKRGVMDNFDKIVEAVGTPFYIEEKMDGERIQLHWTDDGHTLRWYTRKGTDMTDAYGASIYDNYGSLAPYLRGLIAPAVHNMVLDGEMVAWDQIHEEVCALNRIKEAARSDGTSQWRPLLIVFDILHLNGVDLTEYQLRYRKQALDRIYPTKTRAQGKGKLELLPFCEAHTAEEVRRQFDRVIVAMSEGLVVKDPRSKYMLDARIESWLKVKPEFIAGYQGENFDLTVVGGYWGNGKWANRLASFLVAVYDESADRYTTVCRVGSGFCSAIYDNIAAVTKYKWGDKKPESVLLAGTENMPNQWIDPEDSVVFEVKASQVIRSDKYAAGYSLRFPRFVELRKDRDSKSCMSLSQFMELRDEKGQLPGRAGTSGNKRAKAAKPSGKKIRLIERGAESGHSDISQHRIFNGLRMFVAGDVHEPQYILQGSMESLIKNHGGSITLKIDQDTIILADSDLPRVHVVYTRKTAPIVHPRWILDSIQAGRLLPLEPDHYFSCPNETLRLQARSLVDRYGFSLYRRQSPADVKRHLSELHPPRWYSPSELTTALKMLSTVELHAGPRPELRGWLFSHCAVLVDPAVKSNDELVCNLLQFGSAKLVDNIDEATHVVCNDRSQWGTFRQSPISPYIVTTTWVKRCWEECTLLDEIKHRI